MLDPHTGQLLHVEYAHDARAAHVHTECFAGRVGVQLRYDLIDTRIDILSTDVLFMFADSFDWQDVRSHALKDILADEILGNKVYTYIIKNAYASRVRDLRTYDGGKKREEIGWINLHQF